MLWCMWRAILTINISTIALRRRRAAILSCWRLLLSVVYDLSSGMTSSSSSRIRQHSATFVSAVPRSSRRRWGHRKAGTRGRLTAFRRGRLLIHAIDDPHEEALEVVDVRQVDVVKILDRTQRDVFRKMVQSRDDVVVNRFFQSAFSNHLVQHGLDASGETLVELIGFHPRYELLRWSGACVHIATSRIARLSTRRKLATVYCAWHKFALSRLMAAARIDGLPSSKQPTFCSAWSLSLWLVGFLLGCTSWISRSWSINAGLGDTR